MREKIIKHLESAAALLDLYMEQKTLTNPRAADVCQDYIEQLEEMLERLDRGRV